MIIINNSTNAADTPTTEQDVEYKVNGGTPPPDTEPPGPCDIFDNEWHPIERGKPVGPCQPPPGQEPPWQVQFRWIAVKPPLDIPREGPVFARANSTITLRGGNGVFIVDVVTPGG